MKETTRNLLVGTFVLTALGSLAILMVWFGETPSWLRRSEWTLKITDVQDLRGISDGTPVKLNGVEIGRVSSLEFKDPASPGEGVLIVARIKNMYLIPRGALAKVYSATLGIGGGQINIVVEPGADTEPLPRKGAVLHGEMASMLGELVTKEMVDSVQNAVDNIGSLAAAAKPVAENLENLLVQRKIVDLDEGAQANVTTVLERIDQFVENLNVVLGDTNVQEDVKATVRDLRTASEDMKAMIQMWSEQSKKLADNANDGLERTVANLDTSFGQLNEFLEGMVEASRNVANIVQAIEKGEGTAGLLAKDERLYEAAVLAFRRLDAVLANMEHITGKIVEDGYVTIAQETPVGTFTKDFPVGQASAQTP